MRLLTIGSLPPEWGGPVRGGAATFHAALLSALVERGDVEVVGVLPPGPLDREIPVPALIRPEDTGRADFYAQVLDRVRPDVVLMNHIAHTIGVTHARMGAPVPALGVIQSWHNVTFSEGRDRLHARAVTEEALSGLGAMVAVSRHCMDEGRRLGFSYPPRSETIHNPVPPLYMSMSDPDVEAEVRGGVLYLGSLIPRKRPAALVEAATRLPELDVSLVGEGELAGPLLDRIAVLGLGDRVRLTEPPSRDGHLGAIRSMLLRAEVMCLPSRSEGLPLAFVEALACGTPIVGFGPAVREIRDELGIEVGEPLDSGTPEEIAAALQKVRTADWDRRRLRRATIEVFGLDGVVESYVSLLAGLPARV